MSTPKFDALQFNVGCGCGCDDQTGTAQFCEIDRGNGSGLIIKIGRDDVIRVTEFSGGEKVRDGEQMTTDQVEALL